jgi:hypothetical protein
MSKKASKAPRVCFDRLLPSDLAALRSAGTIAPPARGGRAATAAPARAVFLVGSLWPAGTTLKIAFMGGTAAQRAMVRKFAPKWLDYANLDFEWVNTPVGSHMRVAFDPNAGAWSYIGNGCLSIPADQPTMNLGWLDEAVIEHEFGHGAMGMCHEHQNPRGTPIPWNKPNVNHDLSGPPNFWDQATIDHNMYEHYSLAQTNGSGVDPKSVMMYFFPSRWTLDGTSTPQNTTLSDTDKQWAAKVYPGRGTPPPAAVPQLLVGPAPAAGQIGMAGQEDRYRFTADAAGAYVVETLGDSDTLLSVLDGAGKILGTDDDGGEARNARLALTLSPGEYQASVRLYRTGVGKYGIQVRRG